MFLKRLELQGFKSFAEKTKVEFKSGITGVVGPNGSGKSNISDAIRWVLGEQSVKSLRGSKMEDVVFSGTTKRKALGFAEVTLVLDNTENDLPIEYSEVSVTRRVFRTGESEYYINKNSCRLKDIKELFMDTGVGKDGYSVIGQGRIDEILSAKSEGRRNIFEEAAGIVKYKSRKEEAEKKLNKTEENLIRINDIVEELKKQIGPLESQSKEALEYKTLAKELKSLQINLYVHDISMVKHVLKEIEVEKNILLEKLQNKQIDKLDLKDKYNLTKAEIEKMNSNIEKIKIDKYDTRNCIEKKKNEINIISEKISFLEQEIKRYDQEILELNKYIKESEEQIKEIKDRENELSLKIQEIKQGVNEKDIEFREIRSEIEKREKHIEDQKSSVIETFNLIAEKKSKINSLNSFKENIDRRLKQIGDELLELNDLSKDIKENSLGLESKINEYKSQLNNASEEFENISNKKITMLEELKENSINLNNIRSSLQSKTSKHRVLTDMSNEYEGYYKGVKNALKACDRDKALGRGVKGVLAELISTSKKYEKALEIALGASIQNIVIDTQENAKRVIAHLKANNLGRVTFLPMSSMTSRHLNPNEKKLLNESGVIGIGSQLLEYDSQYKNVMEYLLGRVLFVEKIEDGIAVSKKCNYSLRIVSLDGDVLNPGGSMTGGSLNNYNTKLLGRQREIDELKTEIEALNIEYKDLFLSKEKQEEEILIIESKISANNDLLADIKLTIATTESKYTQSSEEYIKNRASIDKFLSEQKNLTDENINIEKDTREIDNLLSELKSKNDETQSNIEKYLLEFEDEKKSQETMNREITELKISKASLEQEYKNIEQMISRLNIETKKSIDSIDKKEIGKQEVLKNIEELKEETEKNNQEQSSLEESFKAYELKLNEAISSRSDYIKSSQNEEARLKQVKEDISQAEKEISSLELKTDRQNIRYENFNSKLWEEYELTFHMALEYKEDIENVEESQSIVRNIKDKIRSLGNININAIEEYKNVKERYEFMTAQIDDLTYAKDSLDEVIKEMHTKMKEQFTHNFEIIRKNFIGVFEELFGGGKADVYLTDEADVLCSGIEIVAQPPGKKLQSLMLLSGGERALTAIALLFAIIKTKPTPFCVLDEIEAALDEANVYRYAEYLREFSSTTQFIAITHRKGTMENVDSLYGVTMEEEGVSKLVSLKLSDKEKVG